MHFNDARGFLSEILPRDVANMGGFLFSSAISRSLYTVRCYVTLSCARYSDAEMDDENNCCLYIGALPLCL